MDAYKEVQHNYEPGAGIFSKRVDGAFVFGVATSTRYDRLYLRGLCAGLDIAKVMLRLAGKRSKEFGSIFRHEANSLCSVHVNHFTSLK